jgi:hypothetical protein
MVGRCVINGTLIGVRKNMYIFYISARFGFEILSTLRHCTRASPIEHRRIYKEYSTGATQSE